MPPVKATVKVSGRCDSTRRDERDSVSEPNESGHKVRTQFDDNSTRWFPQMDYSHDSIGLLDARQNQRTAFQVLPHLYIGGSSLAGHNLPLMHSLGITHVIQLVLARKEAPNAPCKPPFASAFVYSEFVLDVSLHPVPHSALDNVCCYLDEIERASGRCLIYDDTIPTEVQHFVSSASIVVVGFYLVRRNSWAGHQAIQHLRCLLPNAEIAQDMLSVVEVGSTRPGPALTSSF